MWFTCTDSHNDLWRNTRDSLGIYLITSQVAINTSRKIEHLMNINRRESVREAPLYLAR